MLPSARTLSTDYRPTISDKRSALGAQFRYEDHLRTIQEVVRFVSMRLGFLPEEREEFNSLVHVKLLENESAVLRKFRGKCRLRTYLVTVVMRIGLDYRRQNWGKWRPSQAASRLGPTAIRLEALLYRDGRSFEESIEILTTNHPVSEKRQDLERLAARLPLRVRRRFEGEEALEALAASDLNPEATLLESEKRKTLARVLSAVGDAMEGLKPEERVILRLFFVDGFSWKEISDSLGYAPRRLYSMKDRALASLKGKLEACGVSGSLLEFGKGGGVRSGGAWSSVP